MLLPPFLSLLAVSGEDVGLGAGAGGVLVALGWGVKWLYDKWAKDIN